MFEKMSDGDVAVYLRNAALQLLRLSQERGVDITIVTRTRGYMNVRAGDYEIYKGNIDDKIRYQYRPLDGSGVKVWRDDITPQSISLICRRRRYRMNEPFTIIENRDHASWLKARTYGIGGSDASAIVGMNPYKTNIDLFEEKIGRRVPEDISDKPYVKYGTLAEEHIRALFSLDYPEYKVSYHENRILRSKTYPFLQASLDGGTGRRKWKKRNSGN